MPVPAITDTFLIRLPVYLYNQSLGRVLNKQTSEHVAWEAEGEQEQVDEAEASLRSALPANANGESRKRKSKAKS